MAAVYYDHADDGCFFSIQHMYFWGLSEEGEVIHTLNRKGWIGLNWNSRKIKICKLQCLIKDGVIITIYPTSCPTLTIYSIKQNPGCK